MKEHLQGDLPLIIGPGMSIKGTIHSERDVIINGEVEGELEALNCAITIGPHGKVFASAKAREVEIQGIITGDVEASGTTAIRETGQLVGDLRTCGIIVEAGAVLRGAIEIVPREGALNDEKAQEPVDAE